MVFSNKSLESMLENCEVQNKVTHTLSTTDSYDWLHSYIPSVNTTIEKNVNLNDYAKLLITLPINKAVSHALENSYQHGYNQNCGKEINVVYHFCEDRFVIQVIDFGTGFDVEKTLREFHEKSGTKGVSYQGLNSGMKFFARPEIEVSFKSSQDMTKGTTVNVMYLFDR